MPAKHLLNMILFVYCQKNKRKTFTVVTSQPSYAPTSRNARCGTVMGNCRYSMCGKETTIITGPGVGASPQRNNVLTVTIRRDDTIRVITVITRSSFKFDCFWLTGNKILYPLRFTSK